MFTNIRMFVVVLAGGEMLLLANGRVLHASMHLYYTVITLVKNVSSAKLEKCRFRPQYGLVHFKTIRLRFRVISWEEKKLVITGTVGFTKLKSSY